MTNDGSTLERQVEHLLRLTPGGRVTSHERIAGKDVDLLFVQQVPVVGAQRVAVECKDYARALTREQVASIWADYEPLTDAVDAVLIATRNGLVPNAQALVDARPKLRHATDRELLDNVLEIDRLVSYAQAKFDDERLREYYQEATCYPLDLDLALQHHDIYFGELCDWCRERLADRPDWAGEPPAARQEIVQDLMVEWENERGETGRDERPDPRLLTRILDSRTQAGTVPLQDIAFDWLERSEPGRPTGLAVLGSYGTGKSSFARAFSARQADRYVRRESGRVPVLIELGAFSVHQSIEGLITHELANRHRIPNASFETFMALNEAGRFLLILDGFDEMKEGMSADALSYNFSELNRLLRGFAKVVLCGRPTVFSSDAERRDALRRNPDGPYAPSRYVEARIAPMPVERVRAAISGYAKARRAELGVRDEELDELHDELDRDDDLRELLARPVHYPMLLRVLPTWKRRLSEMTRASLYEAFIIQTIARESKAGRPGAISDLKRRRFAGDLAMAMFAAGDAWAIRHDQVPNEIVEPFRRGDEALATTRRDLIRSCFLESKAPDILFFPHRSFGEYLVASRFADVLGRVEPDTDALGVQLTPEIGSFLGELLDQSQWRRALERLPSNGLLARFFLDRLPGNLEPSRDGGDCDVRALRRALAAPGTFAPLLDRRVLDRVDEKVRASLAIALRRLGERNYPHAPETVPLLEAMIEGDSDMAAIHAHRALAELAPDVAAATPAPRSDRL